MKQQTEGLPIIICDFCNQRIYGGIGPSFVPWRIFGDQLQWVEKGDQHFHHSCFDESLLRSVDDGSKEIVESTKRGRVVR